MGTSVHYKGTVDDVGQIEKLEDRVVDLSLAIGGKARIWRSSADCDTRRIIRGLTVELAPGLDTLSLLISPEGHLISLFEIEEAEKTPLNEPPWCFCKTQFGGPEAHVTLIELLRALKQDFISNLEVLDEGEYWESRDYRRLTELLGSVGDTIDAMANGLRKYGLSEEAAEDADILASRVERLAALVHKTMRGEARQWPGNSDWDEIHRQN